MPRPSRRSRTFRRVPVKVTSGVHMHYRRRKPGAAHCADCKCELQGVPRLHPVKMAAMARSLKRPERPYGGMLCPSCTRKRIKATVRA